MASLIIKNGLIVTGAGRIIPNGTIVVEGNRIEEIGKSVRAKRAAEVIDARGKLVMPGLICSHSHMYGAFARGMALKDESPSNFLQILERLWWKLDKKLSLKDVYLSACSCLIEATKAGTTSFAEHHASPYAASGSLDEIARACRQAGLRGLLCYEVSDRDGEKIAKAGIEENERFIKKSLKSDKLRGNFGLHASHNPFRGNAGQMLRGREKLQHGLPRTRGRGHVRRR